jgi:formylglycine-generating enzyme required for sulfatase activity
MDAAALDSIAWYGGNSGVNYDLAEGEDTTSGSWWSGKQKQYPHHRAGTRQVKGKLPNAWGLYDMLGNVWEWTQDSWHENYEGAPTDGSAWDTTEAGAARVVRGGSWDGDARHCRSACRRRGAPGNRYSALGFRCARAQV